MKAARESGRPSHTMIAVDGSKESEAAVRWAVDNILTKGDTVVLFNITKTPKNLSSSSVTPMQQGSHLTLAPSGSSKSLAVLQLVLLQQYCKSNKIDAQIETETSDARRAAILNKVAAEGVTHLVMGTGSSGKRTFSFFQKESLTAAVSRRAACSVFLVNARKRLVSFKEGPRGRKEDTPRSRAPTPLPDLLNWEDQQSPRMALPPSVSEESSEELTPSFRSSSPPQLLLSGDCKEDEVSFKKEGLKSPRRMSFQLPVVSEEPGIARFGRLLLPPSLALKLDCQENATEEMRGSPSTGSFILPSPGSFGAPSPASSASGYMSPFTLNSPRAFADSPRSGGKSFKDAENPLLSGRPTDISSPTKVSRSPTKQNPFCNSPTKENLSPTSVISSVVGDKHDNANSVTRELKEQVAMLKAATEAANQVLQVSAALAQSAEADAQNRRRELFLERRMRAAAEQKARALSQKLAVRA